MEELQLLSIAGAARALKIGRFALTTLIEQGKIGITSIGKRNKIPYREIIRFQNETTFRLSTLSNKLISVNDLLNRKREQEYQSLNGSELLTILMGKN